MMKLYAVRDRLIDYYMQPFIGPADKQVLASLATVINEEGNTSAIAQKPEHFELWRLAEIDETTGQVQGDREFIADCGSLVRSGVWNDGSGKPGGAPMAAPERGSRGKAGQAPSGASPAERAPQSATQAENSQGAETDPRPAGTA